MNPALAKKAARLKVVPRGKCGRGERFTAFHVAGDSDTYTVIVPPPNALGGNKPFCNCPANMAGNLCSHLLAVAGYLGKKET